MLHGMNDPQPCLMRLLFREPPAIDPGQLLNVLPNFVGPLDVINADQNGCLFAATAHIARFRDAAMPATLNVLHGGSGPIDIPDDVMIQLYEYDNPAQIFADRPFTILAGDMNAGPLPPVERATLIMDFAAGLLTAYPQCEAIFFQMTGALATRDDLLNTNDSSLSRFMTEALKVRIFNAGSGTYLMDTLGLGYFGFPDLQYHFHTLDPNDIVAHARIMAHYLIENNNPVENDHTVPGFSDGQMRMDWSWIMRYEPAIAGPERMVIDVNTGEFAAGQR